MNFVLERKYIVLVNVLVYNSLRKMRRIPTYSYTKYNLLLNFNEYNPSTSII